ncbi:MAG: putative metal-binding motif-containing protein [Alphaproteobacteria bacterium]|nr:putative metal-binding motif-containing protein [Alphaproteobacteria bacterium]
MWLWLAIGCGRDCTPEIVRPDRDGDGYGLGAPSFACVGPGLANRFDDCDDTDPTIHPDAVDTCNGVDDDCDPTTLEDEVSGVPLFHDGDRDGFGGAPAGSGCPSRGVSLVAGDCDDRDETVFPGAPELCNDGRDDDCDPSTPDDVGRFGTEGYADADDDGYGDPDRPLGRSCEPIGATTGDDCDDGDRLVHPRAREVCNGVDDDCDGLTDEDVLPEWWADADGDTFGGEALGPACESPRPGAVHRGGDCDDARARVYDGAPEHCDGTDEDCDGLVDEDVVDRWYADADGDGWGRTEDWVAGCDPSLGARWGGDCDDTDRNTYPGAPERCGGSASDCDGRTDPCVEGCVWLASATHTFAVRPSDGAVLASLLGRYDTVDRTGGLWTTDGTDVVRRDPGSGVATGWPLADELPEPTTWVECIPNYGSCDGTYYRTDWYCPAHHTSPELGRLAVGTFGELWVPYGERDEVTDYYGYNVGAIESGAGGLMVFDTVDGLRDELAFPWGTLAASAWPVGPDRLWLQQDTELAGLAPGGVEVARVVGERAVDTLDGRMVVLGAAVPRFAGALDGADLGVFEPLDATDALALAPGVVLATLPDGSVVVARGDGVVRELLPAGSANGVVGLGPCP